MAQVMTLARRKHKEDVILHMLKDVLFTIDGDKGYIISNSEFQSIDGSVKTLRSRLITDIEVKMKVKMKVNDLDDLDDLIKLA